MVINVPKLQPFEPRFRILLTEEAFELKVALV
jgi:hypothetical protein